MGLLDGKVAIVTGAGHGIGRGEALELANEGAKVVVNDLGGSVAGEGADKRPAEEVAELIRSRGGKAVANYDDVADWKGAESLVQQAVEAFGTLDVLVNNAGILRDKMIFSMSEEDFDAVIRVHLKGTFAMTHHASAYWRERSKAGNQPRAAHLRLRHGPLGGVPRDPAPGRPRGRSTTTGQDHGLADGERGPGAPRRAGVPVPPDHGRGRRAGR